MGTGQGALRHKEQCLILRQCLDVLMLQPTAQLDAGALKVQMLQHSWTLAL